MIAEKEAAFRADVPDEVQRTDGEAQDGSGSRDRQG